MLDDARLHYVDSAEEAHQFVEWAAGLANRQATVAIDTETTGLYWWTRPFVRLVQFGTADEAWAVDTQRWRGAIEQALTYLVDAQCPILMHNCSFDMHGLETDGYPVPAWRNVHDTKIMSHLLTPHELHGLKPAAARYFGPAAWKGANAIKALFKRTGTSWDTVDTREPDYWVYGNMDTILTYRIGELMFKQLQALGYLPIYDREMAVRHVMYRAEARGLCVDTEWTTTLRHNWTVEAVRLADQLEAAGIKNPLSNPQVTSVLEDLQWEPDEWTPTGAVKLDKVILTQLGAIPEYAHIAPLILRYRRLTKWISVYLDKMIDDVDSNGYIHPTINTQEARTGRMSITWPLAAQTLPGRGEEAWMIRRCILPRPGHQLYSVDYASQEARLFAHYSQDPGLIGCIQRGDDIYTYAARIIYGDQSITKASPLRDITKVNTLAFLYGAGAAKLSQTSGLSIPDSELFIVRLFDAFPNVRDLTGDHAIGGHYPGAPALAAAERGNREGLRYVLTKSGRRFSVPSDNELYKCVNGLMQGGGKDILADAVVRLDQLGYAENIVLPVHDELIFDFPAGAEGEFAARDVASIMEDHSLSVPITTELSGPLDSWGRKYQPKEVVE